MLLKALFLVYFKVFIVVCLGCTAIGKTFLFHIIFSWEIHNMLSPKKNCIHSLLAHAKMPVPQCMIMHRFFEQDLEVGLLQHAYKMEQRMVILTKY